MSDPIEFYITAQGLYSWIKECLDFFDISFHKMDKVKLKFKDDMVTAEYKNQKNNINITGGIT